MFARIFAEPQIAKAIDYESGRDAAQNALDKAAGLPVEGHEHELFSRTIQANVGIGAGMILFGMAMGALFAVAYAVCLGRTGGLRPRNLALLVAGGGFLGMYLVPFLKYSGQSARDRPRGDHPAAQRPVSDHDRVLRRLPRGCRLSRQETPGTLRQLERHALLAGAAFVVAIGIVMLLLPQLGHLSYNKANFGNQATETPLPLKDSKGTIVYPGFPADVLFNFRFYSVAAQLILWTALGLIFAPLAERLLQPARPDSTTPSKEPDPVPA
ncbi:CbtA family protein [Streptomyces sp. L7]